MLESRRGKPAWNSGLKYTEEQKLKVPTFSGRKHSEETKIKMSKARTGKKFSEESILKLKHSKLGIGNKPVLQYTEEGVFIKEWSSIKEAGENLKIRRAAISRCCLGGRKKTGGFIWKHKNQK